MSHSPSKSRLLMVVLSLAVFGVLGCEDEKGLKITGYSPKTGPYTGGDPVVFKGNGFTDEGARGVEVWFGEKRGKNVKFRGDDEMVVFSPGGAVGEVVDITIKFSDARTRKFEKAYTYVDPAAGFGVGELTEKQKKEGQ